jgi:hypothetical protein
MATVALFIMPTSAIKLQSMSLTSSSKLQNCTWLLPSDEGLQLMDASPSVWRATVTRLESVNINCIIVWAGWWNTDHTINYADSPTVWTQFINTVKAVNPNFVVLALVNGWGIDISDPTYRTAMLNAVQQLMSSAPFDGVNDDLENFTGTNQNLIDYWQAEASMVKGMGKIATVDLGVDWSYKIEDVYPYLTNFDYIMPMFYGTIQASNALSYWDRILSNSPVPVIMGLDVNHDEVNMSFSQQLSWIDQALASSPHSNLVGFSIWAYDYWTTNDFAAWTNWATKGSVPSPTLTPLEATIMTAAIIAIVAAVAALLFRKKAKKLTAEPKEIVSIFDRRFSHKS